MMTTMCCILWMPVGGGGVVGAHAASVPALNRTMKSVAATVWLACNPPAPLRSLDERMKGLPVASSRATASRLHALSLSGSRDRHAEGVLQSMCKELSAQA